MRAIATLKSSLSGSTTMHNEQTILDEHSGISGEFKCYGPTRIAGHVSGKVIAKGLLIIAESAVVEADISGDSIVICGKVTGDISVTEKAVFAETAIFKGDLLSPLVEMENGARFDGSFKMTKAVHLANAALDEAVGSPVHALLDDLDEAINPAPAIAVGHAE